MNDIQKAIDSLKYNSLKELYEIYPSDLKSLLEQVAREAFNEGLATDEFTPYFFDEYWDDLNLTFNED